MTVETLVQKIDNDWKSAIKAGKAFEKNVLTNIRSSLKSWKIDHLVKTDLTDDQATSVMDKMVKQLKDAISQAQSRPDAVDQLQKEVAIIEAYLPQKMSVDAVKTVIQEIIGRSPERELAAIMKASMAALKGKADGSLVAKTVKELL